MKAIILAAGKGSRLGSCANGTPKCLLEIGDRCILDYQLESLRAVGIMNIVTVLGYKKELIQEHLARYQDMQFTIILNNKYDETNTAYSLWLARSEMLDDFICYNADVLLHPEITRRVAHAPHDNVLAVTGKSPQPEEVKVILENARITSIGKNLDPLKSYGKFTGIARFSQNTGPRLVQALEQVLKQTGGMQEDFEAGLSLMTSSFCLTSVDVTDLPCSEIDFPDDLVKARGSILRRLHKGHLAKRKTILFYVERNLHLPFLEPVHDYIKNNFSADVAFSAAPYRPAQRGVPGTGLEPSEIERLKSKSTFYAHPEECNADAAVVACTCFYPVRHCKKIINIGHGLISKGYFYKDDPVVRRENAADLICVPGTWHKSILEKNVFSPICVTGFIKSDSIYYCNQSRKDMFFEKYGIPRQSSSVLYAPTFNEELSSIPCIRERIAELADHNTAVLVKLHGMTGQKWVDMYRELASRKNNIFLIEDADLASAMVCADVMISDVSSVFVEFLLLDKPVVLYNNPLRESYSCYDSSDIEYRVRDAVIEVGSIEELKLAVRLSLACPGEYHDKRREYADVLGCVPDGKCAQRAAENIMDAVDAGQDEPAEVEYSIVVQWDYAPSHSDIETTVRELQQKSRGLGIEILFAGPRPTGLSQLPPGVSFWEGSYEICASDLCKAAEFSRGRFIIFVKPLMAYPKLWARWMSHYFRWHPETGAVRAVSDSDDYSSILHECPPGSVPDDPEGISDYFLYHLSGNNLEADTLGNACFMISRKAYDKAGGFDPSLSVDGSFETLAARIRQSGLQLWYAVEVFVSTHKNRSRPADGHAGCHDSDYHYNPSVSTAYEVLCSARQLKKEKRFSEAAGELERAKLLVSRDESSNTAQTCESIHLLLQQSRALRKQHNYAGSIELLETAKSLTS